MSPARLLFALTFLSGCFLDRSGLVAEIDAGRERDAGMASEDDAGTDACAIETCDGTDDDCDGVVDEDLSEPCSTACGDGVRTCTGGSMSACSAPEPAEEECNNLDDDCDGRIDGFTRDCSSACGSGTESCSGGVSTACTAPQPSDEICNNLDDDCDGTVDTFMESCATACGTGFVSCVAGVLSPCTAPMPAPEACNGMDDDCDGTVDGMTRPCMNSCRTGTETCSGGTFGGCNAPPPGPEMCNNADDDCDGRVDDFSRGCMTACGTAGSQRCVAGVFQRCVAMVTESCNAVDDDCNGTVDDPGACPCTTRTFGGHVYQFCNWTSGWWGARDQCVGIGYRLVTIQSDAENTFVANTAMSVADEDWWIGYNDLSTEMTWAWTSGVASAYTAWGTDQPSGAPFLGSEQDCANVTDGSESYETRNRWNDSDCSSSLRFVCETIGP